MAVYKRIRIIHFCLPNAFSSIWYYETTFFFQIGEFCLKTTQCMWKISCAGIMICGLQLKHMHRRYCYWNAIHKSSGIPGVPKGPVTHTWRTASAGRRIVKRPVRRRALLCDYLLLRVREKCQVNNECTTHNERVASAPGVYWALTQRIQSA